MTSILPLTLLVVFAACVAFSYGEGMWANALRLVNIVTAGLLATSFYEPLAKILAGLDDAVSPYADFLALWIAFLVAYLILRTITDSLSRTKVRFMMIVDRIGSAFFSMWAAWVMVCFVTMTLHTAPLAEKFMWGGFDPAKKLFFGVAAPDRQWLAFTQTVSRGSFDRGQTFPDGFIDRYSQFRRLVESKSSIPER